MKTGQLKQYRISPWLLILYVLIPFFLAWFSENYFGHEFLVPKQLATEQFLLDFFAPRRVFSIIFLILSEIMIYIAFIRFTLTLKPSSVSWTPLFGPTVECPYKELIISEFRSQNNVHIQLSHMGEHTRNLPFGLQNSKQLLADLKRIASQDGLH